MCIRDSTYILLITDRFSRRADMFPVTAAEFTAEGTANILVNKYILLWGCPRTILSDNGLQFCPKLSQAVYQLLGVRKLATSPHHPNGNGGVERVNHIIPACTPEEQYSRCRRKRTVEPSSSYWCALSLYYYLRGTIVIRTCDEHKKLYFPLFY